MDKKIPVFKLSNGVEVPAIAFGVGSSWRVRKIGMDDKEVIIDELVASIENAIDHGFAHIDSAEIYDTRRELKKGLAEAEPELITNGKKLFLADKHFCGFVDRAAFQDTPYDSLTVSLEELGREFFDLYYLHSQRHVYKNKELTNLEQWQCLEKAYNEKKTRSIGVSNYDTETLKDLLSKCLIKPHVQQIEYHVLCQDKYEGIIDLCKKNDILVVGYAPLAPLVSVKEPNSLTEFVKQLLVKYGKTEAQILLRWVYQSGVLPVTTSSKSDRLKEALEIFEFVLETGDFEKMKKLGNDNQTIIYNW